MTTLISFFGWFDVGILSLGVLILFLIYRKKITAWIKSLFAKKQNETPTDTKS